MNISRAKEILGMDAAVDVELNGVPIWIDTVDTSTDSVVVYLKNNPSSRKTVSVQDLKEV